MYMLLGLLCVYISFSPKQFPTPPLLFLDVTDLLKKLGHLPYRMPHIQDWVGCFFMIVFDLFLYPAVFLLYSSVFPDAVCILLHKIMYHIKSGFPTFCDAEIAYRFRWYQADISIIFLLNSSPNGFNIY